MERAPGDGSSPSPVEPPATAGGEGESRDPPAGGPGAAGEALAVLGAFGRRLLVLVPVYLAGAAGLSVGFVLFGLALYLGWRRVRDAKARSLRVARLLLDDEERLTAETLYLSQRELPAWVSERTSEERPETPPGQACIRGLATPRLATPRLLLEVCTQRWDWTRPDRAPPLPSPLLLPGPVCMHARTPGSLHDPGLALPSLGPGAFATSYSG